MHWEVALKEIEKHPDLEKQKPVLDLLHQEINQGRIDDPLFLSSLEGLYNAISQPGILSEIKRMQNRFKIRKVLGCDLLRMTSPPLKDRQKKQMWDELHSLQAAYNESEHAADKNFLSSYKVLNKIGDGGMSVVFKGIRLADKKEVAIKFLKEEYFTYPAITERFKRECKMCLTFDHPNIIDVFEMDKGGKAGYMVMEHLSLGGVDTILRDERLTLKTALDIIIQVAQAISYIHKKQIIHRDIKLSNLLIKSWENENPIHIKLCDFGISKVIEKEGLTVVGTKMGTEFYTAPEQRESPENADFRSDIYSLGVCLYRLISRKGFPEGNFPSVEDINPQTPKGLNAIILKCLNHEPKQRFQSVDEFLKQIKEMALDL